jgi:hypothetical protein
MSQFDCAGAGYARQFCCCGCSCAVAQYAHDAVAAVLVQCGSSSAGAQLCMARVCVLMTSVKSNCRDKHSSVLSPADVPLRVTVCSCAVLQLCCVVFVLTHT